MNALGAGIIPANTGRILYLLPTHMRCRDHPREYGENDDTSNPAEKAQGSSPRIRGEYPVDSGVKFRAGIIPANTGRMVKSSRV